MVAWFKTDYLERIWKDAIVAQFEILSRFLVAGTKENHDLWNKRE